MAEMAHMVEAGDCTACAGCGYVANDDDRSPWTLWANLPPGSDLAVRLGVVKRETCDACGGTGNAPAAAPAAVALTFAQLRTANVARLPLFKNRKGEPAHSEPDGSDWSPAQWLQAVAGELGEYANLRKKFERGDIDEAEFLAAAADEMGDVVTYMDLLAFRLGIDLGAATVVKWNRISERIGVDLRLAPSGTYTIQEIPDLSAPDGAHYRITDNSDSRIATCYLRENAEVVCAALNATPAVANPPSADADPEAVKAIVVETLLDALGDPSGTGCEAYLAANGHNLNEPRIYVEGGWRNGEWEFLRTYFINMGLATPAALSGTGGYLVHALEQLRGKVESTYTEREVDLCLSQAAALRDSYAARSADGMPNYSYDPEHTAEAVEWDTLARKIATELGPDFELEKQCNRCTDGFDIIGNPCKACNGTGLWPVVLPETSALPQPDGHP